MIHTQDMMEKLMPVTEEKEREDEENIKEEEEEETEEEEIDGDDEEEGEEDAEEKDGRVDKEKEEEEMPQAADETQEKIPLPAQPKDKKPADVLNLNNEVVKMRKEVKRVRALIIRKLTRQIVALKKKKGKEIEIERNQRRADRLLEEIHAMKVLLPDLVTKTALQKNLNFEQVCKNPKSNISDRAVARIATHPQYNRKIEDIKAAVKAFKEERMKDLKEDGKEKVQKKAGQVNPQSPDKRGGRKSEKEEDDITTELIELSDDGERDSILIDTEDSTTAKPEKDTGKAAHSAGTADVQKKEIPESESVRPGSKKSSEVEAVRNETQNKDAVKKPIPSVLHNKQDTEGSDLETSDEEEKEYFDDSTEERFHKQSSQSEESDDDFFVGKVSKIKKKKQKSVQGDNKVEKEHEVKGESIDKLKTSDKDHSELDELESRLKSKAKSLQSVFCTSLSGSKQRGGIGKGRGGDKFRGQRNPKGGAGLNRDFSKQSKFQKQVKETGAKHSRSYPEGTQPEVKERGFASSSRGRGRGRGRGDVIRQKTHMSGGVFSNQAPQQALHPSWEASKKRKEQQGQILAFQGKKIKFDDDDD